MATAPRRPWRFSLRGLLLFTLSVAIGLSMWKTEHALYLKVKQGSDGFVDRIDWYIGALATLSFWIVLGLATQASDLLKNTPPDAGLASEERWGHRFAIAWRIAICAIIGAYFCVRTLVGLDLLAMKEYELSVFTPARETLDAVLLVSIIVAIGSVPRFNRVRPARLWHGMLDLVGAAIAAVLVALFVLDRMVIPDLVYITIVCIQMAQRLEYSADVLGPGNPSRAAGLCALTTVGMALVVASLIFARLLAISWRKGNALRTSVAAVLAVSMVAMTAVAHRIAIVEMPRFASMMVASIPTPQPVLLFAASALVVLATAVVARRWSNVSQMPIAVDISYSHHETRYYHERVTIMLLLAGLAIAQCIWRYIEVSSTPMWCMLRLPWTDVLYDAIERPLGCLSLALVVLAVQGVLSSLRKRPDCGAIGRPSLTPSLFLVTWSLLLTIVVCGVPILAAWGFLFRLVVAPQ